MVVSTNPIRYLHRSSELREAQVNVSVAQVVLVELVSGAGGLVLVLEEDESVASGSTVAHVDRDVTLSHAEVLEEITDLTGAARVGQSAHLESTQTVLSVDEI